MVKNLTNLAKREYGGILWGEIITTTPKAKHIGFLVYRMHMPSYA